MMTVFVDTNVLLDVLARREPFYGDAAQVWTLAEEGRIGGFVSPVSLTNVFYIVRRLHDVRAARRALVLLRDTFKVAVCDEQLVDQALDSGIADFEDAVQYFGAVRVKADCIVSRDPRGFPRADPPVLTPREFLSSHSFE
jgi:predicted nucleic acid-binding protein